MRKATSARPSRLLLRKLVEVLVEQWGQRSVEQMLAAVAKRTAPKPKSKASKKSTAPSAEKMVMSMEIPMDMRPSIIALAKGLDDKSFLGTSGSMKHFLEMRGMEVGPLRRRHDGFKTVLSILRDMPRERLARYVESLHDGGPGDLASISDAISHARPPGSHDVERAEPPNPNLR